MSTLKQEDYLNFKEQQMIDLCHYRHASYLALWCQYAMQLISWDARSVKQVQSRKRWRLMSCDYGRGSEVGVTPVCVCMCVWWGDDWARHPDSRDRHLWTRRGEKEMKMSSRRRRSVFTCLDIPEALQRSTGRQATRKAPLHSSL